MNEIEQGIIRQFVDNKTLFALVGKSFDIRINKSKPEIHWYDSNNVVGQKYRAYAEAKALIAECFNELLQYQSQEKMESDFNKGR